MNDEIHFKFILEQIEKLKALSERDRDDFAIELACQKCLENIGESCSKISNEMRKKFPKINWREIVGMRNILVHNYFGVNQEDVWNAADEDIHILEKQVKAILKKIKNKK